MKFDYESFKNHFQDILSGEIFRKRRIRDQYPIAILIVVLFGIYIDNGYRAQRQQVHIVELERAIEDANYEYLSLSATYVNQTRQSVILQKLKDQGSHIDISITPAIRIE